MSVINTEPIKSLPHANARTEIMRLQVEEPRMLQAAVSNLGEVWDYSFARPALENTPNIKGVCRYLDYLPNSKVISASELAYILRCGKVVLFNWENGAVDMRQGASAGKAHGLQANRILDSLGIGVNIPIVYSADWDAQPNEYEAIQAYLDAAHTQGRPPGIYGKNAMVHYMLSNSHAVIGWTTLAWLYGQKVSPLTHLFQDGVNSPN